MDALICDVCGGKIVMKAEARAQCEYCGLEYTMERLKEKIIEIKGTVNVQGIATKENLKSRADEFFEHRDLDKALEYYHRYLDLEPTNNDVKEKIKQIDKYKSQVQKPGELLKCTVLEINDWGIRVDPYKGLEGIVHISKLSTKRINSPSEIVNIGDEIWVVCLGRDEMGRVRYSARDGLALEKNNF